MSNKGMKIGTGKNYDLSEVSKNGLTLEDIAKMNANAAKLINIYDIDGQDGLTKIELAYAMDGFLQADNDVNGKLSDNELEAYAQQINREKNLSGNDMVSGKDLKAFLKDVRKFTKDDVKESRATIIVFESDIVSKLSKDQYEPVEGQYDIYQKDGKYYKIIRDGNSAYLKRVKQENGTYIPMTNEELADERERELKDEMDQEAKNNGYTPVDGQDGVYSHLENGKDLYYMYDRDSQTFVRARLSWPDNKTYIRMTEDEIVAEIATEVIANNRIEELKTPKAYTVQLSESFDDLINRSLKAQGIASTAENIATAKAEFIKNNPNAVHTNRRGVQYLYAGDVVQIAGNLEDKNNADEVKKAYRAQQAERARAARGSSPQTSESSSTTENDGNTFLEHYDETYDKMKFVDNDGTVSYFLQRRDDTTLIRAEPKLVAKAFGLHPKSEPIYEDGSRRLYYWDEFYHMQLISDRGYTLTEFGELTKQLKTGDIVTYTFDFFNHRIKTVKFEYTDPDSGHRRTCCFDYSTIVPGSSFANFNRPHSLWYSKDAEDYLSKKYRFNPNNPSLI